jgi:multidrug resistance efflux pump
LFVVALVAAVPVIAWIILPRLSLSSQDSGPVMATVERGLFVHDITERGSIESANNVEIDCKVKSRSGGITILEVVPEGTVIKPEDCIPENAVVSLEALLKLDQWLERKARGLTTEEDEGASDGNGAKGPADGGNLAEATEGPSPQEDSEPQEAEASDDSTAADQTQSNGDGPGDTEDSEATETIEALDQNPFGASTPDEDELTFEEVKDKMVLVRFNSKEFEDSLLQQQIVCENSLAAVKAANAAYNTAVISRKEYLEGTFKKEEKTADAAIVRAKEALTRAEEYLNYSKELYDKGFIPENELKANEFAVTDKQLAWDIAELDMVVLKDYTKAKEIERLEAEIGTAQAKLVAAEKSYELDQDNLEEIEEQIVNCWVFARNPGQVVYANETNRWGSNEIVIEPGATIRERQTILRLPDPANMQVNTKINEAKVSLVSPGMRATVRLEASPNEALKGEVIEVGEYPAATSWMRGDVKEYEVLVKIEGLDKNPRKDLRAGFTAEVGIRVAEQKDALQLPIQAILEHGGKHYVVVSAGDADWEAKQIQVGLSNDKFVVIKEGLEDGDKVVHNAIKYRDDVDLPEIKEEPQAVMPEDMASGEGEASEDGGPGRRPGGAGQRPGGAAPGAGGQAAGAGGFDPAAIVGRIFTQNDKDSNGKLEGDEIPAQMKERVSAIDTNGDGAVDRAEMTAAMSQFAGRGGGGGRPGGPGGPGAGGPGAGGPRGGDGPGAGGPGGQRGSAGGRPGGPGGGGAGGGRPRGGGGGGRP